MEFRQLGRSDLRVSKLCLGTMTWGEQNTEAEGHAQMDAAVAAGINFFDAAEMYPVPTRAETYGRTEEILGSWLAARGCRDKIVVASKVAGPGRITHIRPGRLSLDAANINKAVELSLKRLRTDYIDLYQLHWPDRSTNMFGKLGYTHAEEPDTVPLETTLSVLADLVRAGKIRTVGLSNETPWGVMTALRLAETAGLPRAVSVQNPYSLLNRSFEVGLAEVAIREQCGLLAYSPLGMGVLSGKYLGGAKPSGARLTLFPQYVRYSTPAGIAATEAYVAIARRHGLDPAAMALAYVTGRPFTTATIIGQTSLEQLAQCVASAALTLSDVVLAEIEAVHALHPYPCP